MLVGIYTNPERDVRLEVTKKLAGLLRREEVDFALHESLKDKLNDVTYFGNNDKPDVIIALGGDGTILSAVDFSAEKKIPVIGVNLGRLGFLSECTADRLEECVLRLKKGDYTLTERAMLETYVGEKRLLALNEIVFYKGNVGRTVTLSVNVGGSSLGKFKCDGYMVSTPTGSTGYALSSGGPVLSPHVKCSILVPLNCHHLSLKPVVIDDNEVVVMESDELACVIADGRVHGELTNRITITKSVVKATFISFENTNFYRRVHDKLGGGIKEGNA